MYSLFKRLWHSPTFTSWVSKAAVSLRLLVIMPLLLNRFDDVELSAWLLFSSFMYFSELVVGQTNLVFSRMIALVNGGAKNLAPVTSGKKLDTVGETNWLLMERLFGSLSILNGFVSILGILIAAIMGVVSLPSVIGGHDHSDLIWSAFGVFIVGGLISYLLKMYSSVLRGLNKVSLTNRWDSLFAIISAFSGAIVLFLEGNIFHMALVMEFFVVLGSLLQVLLLYFIVEPRFRDFKLVHWDREINAWVWPPLWRGMVQNIATRGGTRIGLIMLSRHLQPSQLSSVLLSVKLLTILEGISIMSVSSHVPRFGKLLGQGNLCKLRESMIRGFRITAFTQCSGIIFIGFSAYLGIALIKSSVSFLELSMFFPLAVLHMLAAQVRQSLIICASGNNIVAIPRLTLAALITLIMTFVLLPIYGFWGFIVSAYVPLILIVNLQPLRLGCRLLGITEKSFIRSTTFVPWLCLACAMLIALFLPVERWSIKFAELIGAFIG